MLRFGIISELKPEEGRARVTFEEDGITSDFLPISVPKTGKDKYYFCPDVGDQVACLMDENAEDGVIVGSVYSDVDTPASDVKGADVVGIQFSDGVKVIYDRSTSSLTIDAPKTIKIVCQQSVTVESKTAKVTAPDGVEIVGDTTIRGSLAVIGNMSGNGGLSVQDGISAGGVIESQSNVVVGAITLTTHKHPDTTSGGITGPAVP